MEHAQKKSTVMCVCVCVCVCARRQCMHLEMCHRSRANQKHACVRLCVCVYGLTCLVCVCVLKRDTQVERGGRGRGEEGGEREEEGIEKTAVCHGGRAHHAQCKMQCNRREPHLPE